jgi:hypothetical protein
MNIRRFSPAGPCITLGSVLKETPKFYVYSDRHNGRTKKVSKDRVHSEPCSSCRDHPNTCYPNGYMD